MWLIKYLNHFFKPLADEDLQNEKKNYRNLIEILINETDVVKAIVKNETVVFFDDILQCVKNQNNQLIVMSNIVKVLR